MAGRGRPRSFKNVMNQSDLITVTDRRHLRLLGFETYPSYVRATAELLLRWLTNQSPQMTVIESYVLIVEMWKFDNEQAKHEHTIESRVRETYLEYETIRRS